MTNFTDKPWVVMVFWVSVLAIIGVAAAMGMHSAIEGTSKKRHRDCISAGFTAQECFCIHEPFFKGCRE